MTRPLSWLLEARTRRCSSGAGPGRYAGRLGGSAGLRPPFVRSAAEGPSWGGGGGVVAAVAWCWGQKASEAGSLGRQSWEAATSGRSLERQRRGVFVSAIWLAGCQLQVGPGLLPDYS